MNTITKGTEQRLWEKQPEETWNQHQNEENPISKDDEITTTTCCGDQTRVNRNNSDMPYFKFGHVGHKYVAIH